MAKETKKIIKRLTPGEYEKAKGMWGSGMFTLSEISKKFDVSIAALTKRFKKDGIKKGQNNDKHQKAIDQSLENMAIADAEDTVRLISERKQYTTRMNEMLQKRAAHIMMRATKDEVPLGAMLGDLKFVTEFHKLLTAGYQLDAHVLGIDRIESQEKTIPKLVIEEMTAEMIEQVRQQQVDDELDDLIEGDIGELADDEIEIGDDEESFLAIEDEKGKSGGDFS